MNIEDMTQELGVEPDSIHDGCGHPQYLLSSLEAHYGPSRKLSELTPNLYCMERWKDCGNEKRFWVKLVFVEFTQSNMDGSNLQVTHLLSAEGPSNDGLRECRHTRIGQEMEGYVYYMDFGHMRQVMDELERFFDGD
jgi:hypothetical protein